MFSQLYVIMIKTLVAVVFLSGILYILYKERQSLGCGNILEGKDCDNINGKAVLGTKCSIGDNKQDIFKKIELGASYCERFVTWRSYVLTSLASSIFVCFLLSKRFPRNRADIFQKRAD